jgi:signal transduction histidine kinase
LHDSVTQAIYSVTLYAEAARLALSTDKRKTVEENLQQLKETADEALQDMRLVISELHPPDMEQGLAAAIRSRLAAVESRAGLATEILDELGETLPPFLEEELYWIAKEALTNVVKHAKADRVSVLLKSIKGSVCMEVIDDGIGFDPIDVEDRGGMGLRLMKERAQGINGDLEIKSEPGNGTTLGVIVTL